MTNNEGRDRNCGRNTDGRFAKGNPGKRAGTRHRATLAAEALLDGEAEALTRKAVQMALEGDTAALRLCLERIAPPRRDRPVQFEMPSVRSVQDAMTAIGGVLRALGEGGITPSEASELCKLLTDFVRLLESTEIERRLTKLEERHA